MPDPRFYDACGPISLDELATLTGSMRAGNVGTVQPIEGVAPLGRGGPTDVSFLIDKKFLKDLASTKAGGCFISENHAASAPVECALLVTSQPQAAYGLAAAHLHPIRIHPPNEPALHPDAQVEEGVLIGPGVVLGPGARVGRGTRIAANAVIGPGVAIGRDCFIGSNVSVGFALIGDRVRLLPNAVIGAAGFGVAASSMGAVDAPQLGRVILQDGVTVGACSCIDRGAWEDTVVGENTKIDNLVQIGHNVRIGRNCVLAAQTGIAGSTTVGDGAQFGGKAGIGDHLLIGHRVRVAAGAAVMRDIPDGETWCGAPAKPIRKFLREIAWLSRQAETRESGGS